ncbi:cell division control protein 48 homolog B [Punica granatum]|nr:cell division control protein 48 homolog B [Punica granatum]
MAVSSGSSSCSGVYSNGKAEKSEPESVRWRAEEAIGGNREALEALRELISFPVLYSREARKLGLKWPGGLLLYGPPGTGKTSLVRAVVRECNAQLTIISPHSVHKAHAGESEKILREAFSEASAQAKSGKPSVIFIDEIDVLCPRRDSRREQDVRLAAQLFTLMDSSRSSSIPGAQVIVVASTNRVDAVDPALRRSGRFDAEIEVTTPSEGERFQILQLYTKKLPLDSSVKLKSLAASCNGYVGADLEALCREATRSALKRSSNDDSNESELLLTFEDWECARSVVGPSITRGVTVEVPKVSWEDIGGLKDLKKKLQQAVEWPIKHPAAFSRLGISPIRGVLLHGPPGCSKTTLAKAVAHAAQASFFSLSGAELYSMYVGEGEALLRNTFRRARLAAPSIIFFDEADVVAGKRGGKSSSNISVGERLLSTLLTEMDGLEQAKGILVLAATNRPQAIDAALLRPGRFDLLLYVPPPDIESRYEILRVHTRNMEIASDVDLRKLAEETELFTGAELEGLCREAGIVALREDIHASSVRNRHFQAVRQSLKPALTKAEIDSYALFLKASPLSKNSMSPMRECKADSGSDDRKRRNYMVPLSPVKVVAAGLLLVTVAAKYILGNADQKTPGMATT